MLKAIETQYKGYRFRSRLEARWAVFLDTVGLPWRYELEGFDLGGAGWYLPDFFLPSTETWLEIKPPLPKNTYSDVMYDEWEKTDARAKVAAFGQSVQNLIVLHGEPWLEGYFGEWFSSYGWDSCFQWCECRVCGKVGLAFEARSERLCSPPPDAAHTAIYSQTHGAFDNKTPKLLRAYQAARSARFERGAATHG